jgi:hypothetical protein
MKKKILTLLSLLSLLSACSTGRNTPGDLVTLNDTQSSTEASDLINEEAIETTEPVKSSEISSSCTLVFDWLEYFYQKYNAQEVEMESLYSCIQDKSLSSAVESSIEYEVVVLTPLPSHPKSLTPRFLTIPSQNLVYDYVNYNAGLKVDGTYRLLNQGEVVTMLNELDPRLSLLLTY